MTATTYARTMWPMAVEQAPSADRVAISTDWEMLGIFRASPTTGEPIKGALLCKVDTDAGTVGELRMRPVAAAADGPSTPQTVSGPASGVRLGFQTLVAGTDQLVYLEGRRVSGTGGVRVISAVGTVISAPPSSLYDPAARFTNTSALVGAFIQPQGHALAWMPNIVTTSPVKTNALWTQGQSSSFTNDDGSPSYGFWYPNTLGGSAYSNADYNFIASVPNAFSGSGYVQVIQKNPYGSSVACQLWRTLDQAGNLLPPEMYISWRMKFHEVISYDHVISGPVYGFTNMVQVYKTQPTGSRGPFITLGAGRDLATDSAMRWHINLDNRASYDLTQITTPSLPINQWIHMEVHVVISDGVTDSRTGKLGVWQDGTKILDYTGPTIADYWEQVGVSWGMYGQLTAPFSPSTVTIDYDECLISTVPTIQNLILPQTAGGLG